MCRLTINERAEQSITKKFRKPIWNKFIASIKQYDLLRPGDKVAVCISGGKDSMLLAKCFQLLNRYSDFSFECEFIAMDPGYKPEKLRSMKENAEKLEIPLHIFEAPIFDYVYKQQEGSPCYLCARMRRGYLYKEAKSLGCNKIALGHHFDDVIETVMMGMLYQGKYETMLPKLRSTNYEGMELIRPLYQVREQDIISWGRYNELEFLRCACRFTEKSETDEGESKRKETKELIRKLCETNPSAADNIFHSVHTVNLSTIVGYRKSDSEPILSFNELYEMRNKGNTND